MKKLNKIIFYNLIFFIILLVCVELLLGNWFKKNNFGFHMIENVNAKYKVETLINNKKKSFIFSRDSFAFRNPPIKPQDIDVLFLGGSTTVESKLPYEETIVGILNKKFKNKDINFVNAGAEGKSTYGYLCDFKYWFSKIDNLKSQYYIFYSGINDSRNILNSRILNCYDFTSKLKLSQKITDYFINNSFILSKYKIIRNQLVQQKLLFKPTPFTHNKFTNYLKAKEKFINYDISNIQPTALNYLATYRKNLNELKKIIENKKIIPIFITQVTAVGNDDIQLFLTNQETKKFAKKNNFIIIPLDEEIKLNSNDFYDNVHTTSSGSRKISEYIYKKIEKIF